MPISLMVNYVFLKHFEDDVKEVCSLKEGYLDIETTMILKLMTLSKLHYGRKLNVNFVSFEKLT